MVSDVLQHDVEQEVERLRSRLAEAEEILRAIQYNKVDALVVSMPTGERVYTLQSAEQPYRILVEQMLQGAATLSDAGLIYYANLRLSDLLGVRHEKLLSTPMSRFIHPADQSRFANALATGRVSSAQVELHLLSDAGEAIPAYLSITPLSSQGPGHCCMVVTDLRERYRNDELLASERLTRSILENTLEAIVVSDPEGKVIRCNEAAQRLAGKDPLNSRFFDLFPLHFPAGDGVVSASEDTGGPVYPLANALRGETLTDIEAVIYPDSANPVYLLLTAGPLWSGEGTIGGTVVTMSDVTRIRQIQRQIEQHNTAIEELNSRLRRSMVETHHRVKNNLQVIAAIIDMSLMDDSEMVPSSELRKLSIQTRTLAAVHDLLTEESKVQDDEYRVSARAVLDKLMPLLQTSADRAFSTDAEDVMLTARQGTSLALATSELVSNALKHGSGQIRVILFARGDCATLTVEDSGPGFPTGFDPSRSNGTGLELVRKLAKWDLGGEIAFSNRQDGGASVRIDFPLGQSCGSG